jgi:hypothetical protein
VRTLSLSFSAGEMKSLSIPGKYFRILNSLTSSVDAEFFLNNRTVGERGYAVDAGYFSIPENGFDRVDITSSSAQTVKIAVSQGRGGYERTVGTVDINSMPAVSGTVGVSNFPATQTVAGTVGVSNFPATQTVAGTVGVNNFPTFMNVAVNPIVAIAAYGSGTLLAAATSENVFAPAANTNGAYLFAASFASFSTGAAYGHCFIRKASAPVNASDGVVVLSESSVAVSGSSVMYGGELVNPVFIPAGHGLYFFSAVAEGAAFRRALYTLL